MTGFRVSPRRLVGARPGAGRPLHVRQGDGRRATGGGVRRPYGDHVPARPGRPGLPGRHAVRKPARLRGRPRDAPARDGATSTRDWTRPSATIRQHRRPMRWPRRACRTGCRPPATCSRSSSPIATCANYDDAKTQNVGGVQGVLPRHAGRRRLPAAERVRGVVRLDRDRRRGAGSASATVAAGRRPRRGRQRGGVRVTEPTTIVHMLRHGEVYNPEKVLYGRLPGYRLSELGVQMAKAAAEYLAGHDVTYLVASPLERAQQTAEPFAAEFGLPIAVDDRLIESANFFEGKRVVGRRRRAARSAQLVGAARPDHAVVGRALPADRPAHVRRAGGGPRARRGSRGGLRLASAADLDRCAATSSAGGCGTIRASGSARWPASRRSTSRHEDRRHRVRRTGRSPDRAVADRPYGQGRLTCAAACSSWPRRRVPRWSPPPAAPPATTRSTR